MLIDYAKIKNDVLLIKPVALGVMSLEETLESIKKIINEDSYTKIVLDLTKVDFFSAIKLGVLVLTQLFITNLNGKIFIFVRDKLVQKSIETLNLNNAKICYGEDSRILLNDIA